MKIFNSPELKQTTLGLLKAAKVPVSIGYVADELHIAWGTARALLLELTLEGKVEGLKTLKSWIFWAPEYLPSELRMARRARGDAR